MRVHAAVAAIILVACSSGSAPAPTEAAPPPATPERVTVSVSATDVRVDDRVVFTLPPGDTLPEPEIPELMTALAGRCQSRWARITVADAVTYGTLFPVTFTVRRAGCTSFELVQPGGIVIPHPAEYATRLPGDTPAARALGGKLRLRLVVTAAGMRLSSESHALGVEVADRQQLAALLAGLARDCWTADGPARTVEDMQIFVAAARGVRARELMPLLQATRGAGGKADLFPHHVFMPPHAADQFAAEPRPPSTEPAPGDATTVRVTILSAPAGALILDERTRQAFGRSPAMLTLPRAGLPMTLLLELDGHDPVPLVVKPDPPAQLMVRLSPQHAAPPGCPPPR